MEGPKLSNKKRPGEDIIVLSSDIDEEEGSERKYASSVLENTSVVHTKRGKVDSMSSTVVDNSNLCFICGVNFQNNKKDNAFELRIQHLKRCSKKYGVSLRDFTSFHEDPDTIEHHVVNAKTTAEDCSTATEEESVSSIAEADTSSDSKTTHLLKQPDQPEPMKNPIHSINNVLMAGAKKLAQTCAIFSKKPEIKKKKTFAFSSLKKSTDTPKLPYHKRISGTDIICDGFQYASKALSTQYFLSHFHSDHYTGLSRGWDIGLIYCSEITAALVHSQLGVEQQFLRPIPLNEPTLLQSQGKAITVTLIDANHCPGAAMFYISIHGKALKNGTHPIVKRILHVGDFRWNRAMMTQHSALKEIVSSNVCLDEIYLDTTYCLEKYRNVPTQQQVIESTIQVMENHMKSTRLDGTKCKTLYLFGSYTIGKERIYLAVAQHFGVKVYVDSKKLKILSMIDLPPEQRALLTNKRDEAFIWVVPLDHVHFAKMPEYLQMANSSQGNFKIQNDTSTIVAPTPYTSVVGFRPTGWSFDERKATNNITTQTTNGITVHGVPYSEHSSFKELVDCVQCLKPKKIIPTVNLGSSSAQIDLLRKYAAM